MRANAILQCGLVLLVSVTLSPAILSPAMAQTAQPAAPIPKVDPSLIPGLRADMLSARAEVQAQLDKGDAAKRELDQRMAEINRWKAQIPDVDKDKALYEKIWPPATPRRTAITWRLQSIMAGSVP